MCYIKCPPAIALGAVTPNTLRAFESTRRRVREEQEQLDLEDFIESLSQARVTLGMC
jgi:hypothetical protein